MSVTSFVAPDMVCQTSIIDPNFCNEITPKLMHSADDYIDEIISIIMNILIILWIFPILLLIFYKQVVRNSQKEGFQGGYVYVPYPKICSHIFYSNLNH